MLEGFTTDYWLNGQLLMEQLLVLSDKQIMLVALGCLGIVLCLTLWFNHRKTRNLSRTVERLQKSLEVSHGSTIGMGQKIMSLQKKLRQLSPDTEDVVTVEIDTTEPMSSQSQTEEYLDKTFDLACKQAKWMLKKGTDIATISSKTGLSPAEVSLLKAVNSQASFSETSTKGNVYTL